MFFAIMKSDLQSGEYTQWEVPVPATLENYYNQEKMAQSLSVIHEDCTFTVVLTNYDSHPGDTNSVLMKSYPYFRGKLVYNKTSTDLHEEYYPSR